MSPVNVEKYTYKQMCTPVPLKICLAYMILIELEDYKKKIKTKIITNSLRPSGCRPAGQQGTCTTKAKKVYNILKIA